MRSRPIAAAITVGVLLLASMAMSTTGASVGSDAAAPRSVLPRSAVPAVARSQELGTVPAEQQITVAVCLGLRDRSGLDHFLQAVATPGTPEYGRYLTPEQFTARYGPSRATVSKVESYLIAHGLTLSRDAAARRVIKAKGTAAQITEVFGTHELVYWDPQARLKFFANDAAASLPSDVAALVEGVSGLNNHTVLAPHLARTDAHRENAPSTAVAGFGPPQYVGAYHLDLQGADGAGTTVALWEFDGYRSSDLRAYDAQFGLSGPAVTTVPVNGADYDSSPGKGQLEVELDSELVRGVAPKATQLVYEAENSDLGEIDMTAQIVAENRVSVISMSWGSCEADTTIAAMRAVNDSLKQAAAQGISVFSSSGDNGSRDCTNSGTGSAVQAVDFPSSDPYVTSTGGTTLELNGNTYTSETGWRGSGGGASSVFAKPSWQSGTRVASTMRTVPDVASDADPSSGFALYGRGPDGPRWQIVGGTSAAAPLWSGFIALCNQQAAATGKAALGEVNPRLYALAGSAGYAAVFHDVTTGASQDFRAGPGYDQVTGWGTPNADRLATALLNGTTVTVTNPGSQLATTGLTVGLQIGAVDSGSGQALAYSATGLPPGLTIDSSTGLVSGTPTGVGVSTVTVTATDTAGSADTATFTWTMAPVFPVPLIDPAVVGVLGLAGLLVTAVRRRLRR